MLDDTLKAELTELVKNVVQSELKAFQETVIVPIQKQMEALEVRVDRDSDVLGPPHRVSSLPHTPTNRSSSFSRINTNLSNSSGILHRVGQKVASTTSSILHGSLDSESSSREVSPVQSPLSFFSDNNSTSMLPSKVSSLSLNGSTSSQSTTSEMGGPITIRRNSGVTRATENDKVQSDFSFPANLIEGLPFLRITHNKKVQRLLRIDKDAGVISWNNKQSSRMLIDRICEIYVGEEARNYREEFKISSEHSRRWATIIHQRPKETKLRALHLIIASQQDFDDFILSLFSLVKLRREIMSGLALAGQNFVNVHWKLNSKSSESLTFSQVLALTRQLHIHCSRHQIKAIFDEADKDEDHYLNFEEFQNFVKLLKRRSDLATIYEYHRIGEHPLFLVRFFTEVQHEPLPDSCMLPMLAPPSVEEFEQMLLSSMKSSTGPNESNLPDLSLPLNNYFICSSHNSYLMGRQVVDVSSIESCIRALQDGCRCLELDCWDGANSGSSPVVYHGHNLTRLTSSVVFSDVIEAVLKYAFISTPYPLILSLEIRCSESSQLRIVSILRTVLARLLVTEPIPGDDGVSLPSPNALKHRILVKVKNELSSGASSGDEGSDAPKQTSICPDLAELGVYFSGRRFAGVFTKNESRNTVYSFNERVFKSIAKDPKKAVDLASYNRNHLSRVYPGPYRLNSSNFDPIYCWKRGVQMVALNWQTFDLGMQLNAAFFSNRVGYVLKPRCMQSHPRLQDAEPRDGMRKLRLTIISAQQLPRPKFLKEGTPFSPYVTMEVFGIEPNDTTNLAPEWTTSAVFDNGFNPVWDYTCMVLLEPSCFEFACLRFTLAAEGQPFAYHLCRVATMSPGYRHVPLVDLFGEDFIFSSLFIKSELTYA